MQIDMHYFGTYAMARAAGLTRETCQIIASSAQFVDDNAGDIEVKFKDGARVNAVATAHHTVDIKNLDPRDQLHVWVPFHFLPGNQRADGKTGHRNASYTELLIARMDSPIARELVTRNLKQSNRPFSRELMGMTAHVYADTFSHYGFSGVSSRHNKIINNGWRFEDPLEPHIEKYVKEKARKFKRKYKNEWSLANIKS